MRAKMLLSMALGVLLVFAIFFFVTQQSAFNQAGQITANLLLWTISLFAILMAIFTWLFDRFVLVRLSRMHSDINSIEHLALPTLRVRKMAGQDELSEISLAINAMLDRLEDTRNALQFERDRAKVTLECIADAVITTNPAQCVVYMNHAAERLTGVEFDTAESKNIHLLFRFMQDDKVTPLDSGWLTDSYSSHEDVILQRSDGQDFVVRKSASPLYDQEGNTFGIVTVLHDVTMLRTLSNQLTFQARHDPLTGLVNRFEFDRKVQVAIEDAATSARTHCIAYLDLDKFKVVNDSCGYMAGDLLLKQLSAFLKTKIRTSDILARIGGDEFALLLVGCELNHAQEIVEELLNAVKQYSFAYEGKIFKVGASIGLTEISPLFSQTLSELLTTVDSACYAAKRMGGDRLNIYRPDDKNMKEYSNQLEWVSRIQLGLEQQLFVLYIQNMASTHEGLEQHCELLIRMRALDGSLYPPGFFMSAAERYHLMPKIDRWVINEAFSIIARKGLGFNKVCGINLSGQTLSEEGFLEYVVDKIKEYQVNTRSICFEITETSVIANLGKAKEFMRIMRELGCRFSLDDFGSGMSSFAYLKNLEVDFLKIDGMFVKAILNNKIDRAMVESINRIGHVMGLHTIAEFAESDAVISVLKEIGVDYMQGYGVAKPELFD